MKHALLAALLLSGIATASPALAARPTAAQKADFYAQCMKIASNEALCNCKAEAAMKLIDEAFMTVVIASMKGKTPAKDLTRTYDEYIRQSNAICIPGY